MRLPRFTTRRLIVLVVVVVVLGCLLQPDQVVTIWDGGHFPLQVDLRDHTSRTIVAIAARPCTLKGESQFFLAHPDAPDLNLVAVPWHADQPFTIRVPCTVCTSMDGREVSYAQSRNLLVRVEYADGSGRLVSAAIPDGRVRRRMTVSIP